MSTTRAKGVRFVEEGNRPITKWIPYAAIIIAIILVLITITVGIRDLGKKTITSNSVETGKYYSNKTTAPKVRPSIILKKKNYLFVDGRYTLQANNQSGKSFKIITIPDISNLVFMILLPHSWIYLNSRLPFLNLAPLQP